MTTYFVDSNAAGAGTGADWTNAYTTIGAAISGKAMGDVFLIEYRHSEVLAALVSFANAALGDQRGVLLRSVDKDAADVFRVGAAFQVTPTFHFSINGVHQGLVISAPAAASVVVANAVDFALFDRCTFAKPSNQNISISNATAGTVILKDCTFDLGENYQFWLNTRTHNLSVIRPVFVAATKGTDAIALRNANLAGFGRTRIVGANLSGWDHLVNSINMTNPGSWQYELRRCTLPASFAYEQGQTYIDAQGSSLLMIGCASGTLSAPAYQVDFQQHEGYCKTVGTHYRTGGATDETTPYSLALLAAANRTWKQSHRAARTIEIVGWVEAGAARTVTVYLAHNAVGAGTAGALTNAECWAEIDAPWVGASPTAQGSAASSMCALDGTPADLTTDGTSSWTGSSIGTHQKIDFTFTPAVTGQVVARVFLAPESASDVGPVYVDAALGIA